MKVESLKVRSPVVPLKMGGKEGKSAVAENNYFVGRKTHPSRRLDKSRGRREPGTLWGELEQALLCW